MRCAPRLFWLVSFCLGFCIHPNGIALGRIPATQSAQTQPIYTTTRPSYDGIGKVYMGREIARVMSHEGADWLERPEREQEEGPSKAIAMMGLKPADVVADIGAGTGYFSFRIARQIPHGKVLAEDIDPQMIRDMRSTITAEHIKNVEPVLGTTQDPKLPERGVDVVIMVDAYHEFDHPGDDGGNRQSPQAGRAGD